MVPENPDFNEKIQILLLRYMISDPVSFIRSQSIIKETYFDDNLQPVAAYVLNYADEFKNTPIPDQIKAYTNVEIEKFADHEITPENTKWYLSTVEKFARYKALESAILDGFELLNGGRGNEVEALVKDAMTISLQSDLGTVYFEDPEIRLLRLKDKSSFFTTGWKSLDHKLYGGFSRGALNVFCGGSGCVVAGTTVRVMRMGSLPVDIPIENLSDVNDGVRYLADSPDGFVPVEQWRNKGEKECFRLTTLGGRSIVASHDHLFQKTDGNWVYARDLKHGDVLLTDTGSDVVMVIEDVGVQTVYDLAIGHDNHRYYTNGISSHNSGKSLFLQNIALNWAFEGLNVVYFSLELSEDLVAMRLDAMVAKMSTSDVMRDIGKAAFLVKKAGQNAGHLMVKRIKNGTTANEMRAYLREYQVQTGRKPDAIVVDYLDLMHPNNKKINPSDLFVKDKYTSEEMRDLSFEEDVFCATASQLNRGSVETKDYDHSHIAGGLSKINTADNVFAILATTSMKENGEIELQMLKTRSSAATGQRIKLSYDPVTMVIADSDDFYDDRKDTETRSDARNEVPAPVEKKKNEMLDLVAKIQNRSRFSD
jgi:replicative DNA helicase